MVLVGQIIKRCYNIVNQVYRYWQLKEVTVCIEEVLIETKLVLNAL